MTAKSQAAGSKPGIHVIPVEELKSFVRRGGAAVGIEGRDLDLLADGLLESDLRGIDTHGIMRLPPYLRGFAAGELNARPQVRTIRKFGATALLDGDNGLGGIVGHTAMNLAVDLAKTHGIGMVSMRNSNHSGMLAQFVKKAAGRDVIAYFVSNGPPAMAPWGALEHSLSNNPFAWGIPAGKEDPLVLDMACSAAARGKIRLAAINGENIPDGWALDNDGNPTNDASVAMTGLILPSGGYKGSGIAVINEVLAAVLPDATLSMDTSTAFLRQGATIFDSWKIGHSAIAIDIAAFDDPAAFKGRVDELIRRLKEGRKAPGSENILMPGEKEELCRRQRLETGIPLSAGVLAEANQVASEMGFKGLT